jgi:3-hydroxybutyryl-CoA dehydratase
MKEIDKGDLFSLPAKQVTQDMINHYADAAEDHNPLHVDPEFAKTTRYGGTIAHGMLSVAFIQELMVRTFGKDWLESGTIEASFMAPVRPGEAITTEAKVMKVTPVEGEETKARIRMQVLCLNAQNEKVIKGQTEVTVAI